MPLRTRELGRLSYTEIEEAAKLRPVLLIPMGTVEQHGPHLPVNADNMVAEFVARTAAEQTHAVWAPPLNYGCSDIYRNFPGTISIQNDTLAQLLEEVCEGYIKAGFRRIIFVNNHAGNEIVVERIARILRARYGMLVGSVYPWSVGFALMKDQYDDFTTAYGHGAEPETSAMLAMFPDDVSMSRLEDGTFGEFQGWQATNYTQAHVAGQPISGTIYFEFDDVARNGVVGQGSLASRERGDVWIERVVGFAVAFINQFDALTRDQDWATGE